MLRGYLSPYLCKCGGRIRITNLEGHFVCEDCNEDYGNVTSKRLEKLKKR